MIATLLKKNQHLFGAIFEFELNEENTLPLDFTRENPLVTQDIIESSVSQEAFIVGQLKNAGARVGVGGYLEQRKLYQRGSIFNNDADPRNIHLGIDLWIKAGTNVYCPFDGEVFSLKNNEGTGDYGPTIILKHQLDGCEFYTLYGHLSTHSIWTINTGDHFSTGDKLCEIGNYPINGDWSPHLHFQILTNLDDFNDGDYPAVCTQANLAKFSMYCPNPNLMLQIPTLD